MMNVLECGTDCLTDAGSGLRSKGSSRADDEDPLHRMKGEQFIMKKFGVVLLAALSLTLAGCGKEAKETTAAKTEAETTAVQT